MPAPVLQSIFSSHHFRRARKQPNTSVPVSAKNGANSCILIGKAHLLLMVHCPTHEEEMDDIICSTWNAYCFLIAKTIYSNARV